MSNSSDLEVVLANGEDDSRVQEYLALFRTKIARQRGGLAWFDSSAIHKIDTGSENRPQLLLCQQHHDLVGCALLNFRHVETHLVCELDLFVPSDGERAKEAIEAFIDHAEKLASKAGESSLDVKSLPGDQLIKSALEERGYKARLLIMNRKLTNK